MEQKNRKPKPDAAAFLRKPEPALMLFILFLGIVISILTDTFFTASNILLISKQIAINGILAIGISVTILSGGLDLSIGSMLGAICACTGAMYKAGLPLWLVILLTILIGAAAGALNGLSIVGLSVPPIIVTLATLNIFKGVSLVLTNGKWFTGLNKGFKPFGNGYTPFIILVCVMLIMTVIMKYTKFGRHIYAVGGNDNSARLSGVNSSFIKFIVYVISGVMVSIATIIYIGRAGSASATAGAGYETQAMAAAVVGGISLAGGKGSIPGAFLGTILMGLLLNAMVALKINANYQGIMTGLMIILALVLEKVRQNYTNRKKA